MAQASLLKSTPITNLDQTPPFQSGFYTGAGMLRSIAATVTCLSGDTTASTYKMVRVPSNAKIKGVWLESAVATAGSADLNIIWSDSTADGTSTSNQGVIPQISAANNKLFGAALSLVAISRSSAAYSLSNLLYANTTNFPQGFAANAAITAAISGGIAGYPASGTVLVTESTNTPLWQMLGLGTTIFGDPGGWFDFQFNVTTAITTGGAITLEVLFSL